MVVLGTSQEWLKQSALLLQARPTSTIVTTKYRVDKSPRKPDPRRRTTKPAPSDPADTASTQQPPTADITFKTYDPASGVCLKYRTNKAAEVGRLFGSLGQLGRGMTGAGEVMVEDTAMPDLPAAGVDENEKTEAPVPAAATNGASEAKGQTGGGASKSKKKKGKR